jgi:hypothetical protein
VIGNYEDLTRRNVTWEQIEQQTDIVVAFGGLAAVRLTDGIRPGVIQLPTGAWYDPEDPRRGRAAVRARQSERADARCGHIGARARLHWPADHGSGRTVQGRPAADQSVRSAVAIAAMRRACLLTGRLHRPRQSARRLRSAPVTQPMRPAGRSRFRRFCCRAPGGRMLTCVPTSASAVP